MADAAIQLIERQDWLDKAADTVQPAVTAAFKAGGRAGIRIKNALHGTWLGHPLHPVLTDIPLGAWTAAAVLDVMDAASPDGGYGPGADAAVAVGLVGAVGAAASGLTDWTATSGRARKVGIAHGVLNGTATLLYLSSFVLRKGRSRGVARGLAFLGYAISGASAYLGGHLVAGEQIGVDHTAAQEPPEGFVPVMLEEELIEGRPTRGLAKNVPILLVKQNGAIHAMAETCSHMGGPLSEGEIIDGTIRCPWHCSRFSLEDGHVVEGPSAFDQPCYLTRVQDGVIEVKAADR